MTKVQVSALPPVNVSVAKIYWASVEPASELASIKRSYQVPGLRLEIKILLCEGKMLSDNHIHSEWRCSLYWIKNDNMEHPLVIQVFKLTKTEVELMTRRFSYEAEEGTKNLKIGIN